MLSATKNFVLTFLIALIIFGLIAYMLVGLILNNILGTSGEETQAPEGTVESPEDEGPGNIGIQFGNGGESFNILLMRQNLKILQLINCGLIKFQILLRTFKP